jgi:hypothetical protein
VDFVDFVVFVVVVLLVVDDAVGVPVVVVVESIFMVVSAVDGAGAMAGADVSAVADSSFLAVHAASTRTAATRARRFIYDLLERQRLINRRSVHAVAVPVFGADENLSHQELLSRAKPSSCPRACGLDYLSNREFPPEN